MKKSSKSKYGKVKKSKQVAILSPVVGGFPFSMRTKLRYVTSTQIDENAGAVGSEVFSANGCFDPDISHVGHQPMGFDVFSQIYKRYLVIGSQLKVHVTCPSASANAAPSAIGVLLSRNSSLTYGSADALMEQGLSSFKLMPMNGSIYRQIEVFSRPFRATEFFDCRDPNDLQDTIGAEYSANPTLQAYFIVWFGQTPSGSDVVALNITVEIMYDVLFDTPLELAQS